MCIFVGEIVQVSGTSIFARTSRAGRQYLVYAMSLSVDEETAMILPLPVPAGAQEGAVEFIDLSGYPSFFDDLDQAFYSAPMNHLGRGMPMLGASSPTLVVEKVGAFDASFVPRVEDFDRLDPRFRLPKEVWSSLPEYSNYGFAVFKLRPGADQEIHPMAFEFPTRALDELFFPTVHIHDGQVHRWAQFDHRLYLQGHIAWNNLWEPSHERPEQTMKTGGLIKSDRTKGIIKKGENAFRLQLSGQLENRDVRVKLES